MSKKLQQLNVRMSDDDMGAVRTYCAKRGIRIAEVVRRAVLSIVQRPSEDNEPGAPAPEPVRVAVHHTEELGHDALRANTGALRR